jgi:hypothetical protein
LIGGRAVPLLCAALTCGSLLAVAAGRARAAGLTVTLDYAAGPDCPNVKEFKAVVVARLGRDPFSDRAPDHVLVRIAPQNGAFDGRIEWRDADGNWAGDQSFSLGTTDCLRLVRSMGFALALQIQLLEASRGPPAADSGAPRASAPPSAPSPPAPPRPAPGPSVPAPALTPEAPHAARPSGAAFAAGVGLSIGFGMSSKPVLLGRALAAASWGHVSVEVGAEVSASTTTRRADGAGFSQQHLLASGAVCADAARWSACVLAKAGEVRMAGENIDRPTSAVAPLVQAGARIGIVQHFGRRFFVDAHADGLANVTRWTGTLDQVPVWTAPPVSAVVGIDVGVRFP